MEKNRQYLELEDDVTIFESPASRSSDRTRSSNYSERSRSGSRNSTRPNQRTEDQDSDSDEGDDGPFSQDSLYFW